MAGVVTAFLIAYDMMAHKELHTVFPNGYDPTIPDAKANEQPGDKERATLTLIYQITSDVLLSAILASECMYDRLDWFADDLTQKVCDTDGSILETYKNGEALPTPPPVKSGWWQDWGQLTFGATLEALAIAAEIVTEAAIPPTGN